MGIHDGHREKMRRRYMLSGLESFADHEVLELLLFYALPRKNTNLIAHELLNHYKSLAALLSAPVENLCTQKGIGESAAILISLCGKILTRAHSDDSSVVIHTKDDAGEYLLKKYEEEVFPYFPHLETIYAVCLSSNGNLLGSLEIAKGEPDRVQLDVRKMSRYALELDTVFVILAHNHPSGIPVPSEEDFFATEYADRALQSIGITLLDHFILADGRYTSISKDWNLGKKSHFPAHKRVTDKTAPGP